MQFLFCRGSHGLCPNISEPSPTQILAYLVLGTIYLTGDVLVRVTLTVEIMDGAPTSNADGGPQI